MKIKKYFALFQCDNAKYFEQLQQSLDGTLSSEYIYQKMFVNTHKYALSKNTDTTYLFENKKLFKNSFNGLKENLLYTETLILLKEYKEALKIFEPYKEANIDTYIYLLIVNNNYIEALNELTEQYRTMSEDVKKKAPESVALKEWLIMFSSLKTNNIMTFKKYSELFLENDLEIREKIAAKYQIAAKPNYSKFGFEHMTNTVKDYKDPKHFFHIENIVYFTEFIKEDLNSFVAGSTHEKNTVKIELKNILHSNSNIYEKTKKYIAELEKLPEELETIEYFNAGLLLSKTKKYAEAVPYFKKSFIKNNLSISGTFFLILNKYKNVEKIKTILLNKYIKKIKENNKQDDFILPMLETFVWSTNRYRYRPNTHYANIQNKIISNYINYINTKEIHFIEDVKKYDAYIELLNTLFFNITKNKYKFISHVQDNLPVFENLMFSKDPIVGETYVKMLKMTNYIELEEFDFDIDQKLLYNPTYLLNYTKYLAYKENYNKSAAVFESFINKSNMHLSLEEKILYSFVNFKSNEDIFKYLVQVNLDNPELNLIKTIYYLNNNEYTLLNKYFKKGTKEDLFLFYINNEEELFLGGEK